MHFGNRALALSPTLESAQLFNSKQIVQSPLKVSVLGNIDNNESRVDFESLNDNPSLQGRENRPSFVQPASRQSKFVRDADSLSSSH